MGCGATKSVCEFTSVAVGTDSFHCAYELSHCLGRGTYGTVYVARRVDSHEDTAVKVVDFINNSPSSARFCKANALKSFRDEREVWTRVGQHPNVVFLQCWYSDEHFGYFVMERCQCTLRHAWSIERTLDEHIYAKYFKDMASALEHIHALGVVHRDVKHDNFLVCGSLSKIVKLADFGCAAVLANGQQLTNESGTVPFMAPEVVGAAASYGSAVDVWSFGVIVYTAFFGKWPYCSRSMSIRGVKRAIRNGARQPSFQPPREYRHSHISEVAMDFVRELLNRDPNNRPSAEECLKTEYLLNKDARAMQAAAQGRRAACLSQLLHGFTTLFCPSSERQPDRVSLFLLKEQQASARDIRAAKTSNRWNTYQCPESHSELRERNSSESSTRCMSVQVQHPCSPVEHSNS